MVNIKEITKYLNEIIPPELAEDYDNVGLLIDGEADMCENVLISLDTDLSVANEAAELGCELVISHHPLMFNPIKRISSSDAVYTLTRHGISLFAAHTNFDSVSGGLCDYLLDTVCHHKKSNALLKNAKNDGLGRIAELNEKMTLSELTKSIKASLALDDIRFVGDEDSYIKTVAICSGGGADLVYDAYSAGADVYISGDFKYHHARFAYEHGFSIIEIPHYNAEIIFMDAMESLLTKKFGSQLILHKSKSNLNPWKIR